MIMTVDRRLNITSEQNDNGQHDIISHIRTLSMSLLWLQRDSAEESPPH